MQQAPSSHAPQPVPAKTVKRVPQRPAVVVKKVNLAPPLMPEPAKVSLQDVSSPNGGCEFIHVHMRPLLAVLMVCRSFMYLVALAQKASTSISSTNWWTGFPAIHIYSLYKCSMTAQQGSLLQVMKFRSRPSGWRSCQLA